MPYYPQPAQGILGPLIGAAATYFQTQSDLKDQEMQRQYMQQQMQTAAQTAAMNQELLPYQEQAMKAQTAGATADAARAGAEADYYRDQMKYLAATTNIALPPKIVNAISGAKDDNSEIAAWRRAAGYLAQQPGGIDAATKILSNTDSLDSALSRVAMEPTIADIRAGAQEYGDVTRLQGVDYAAGLSAGAREYAARAGVFGKVTATQIQAGIKSVTDAEKGWQHQQDQWTANMKTLNQQETNHPGTYPNLAAVSITGNQILDAAQSWAGQGPKKIDALSAQTKAMILKGGYQPQEQQALMRVLGAATQQAKNADSSVNATNNIRDVLNNMQTQFQGLDFGATPQGSTTGLGGGTGAGNFPQGGGQ